MIMGVGVLPGDVSEESGDYGVIGKGWSLAYLRSLLQEKRTGRLPEGVRNYVFSNLEHTIKVLEKGYDGALTSEEISKIMFARQAALDIGDLAKASEDFRQENIALRQIYREYRQLIEDAEKGLALTPEQETRKQSLVRLINIIDERENCEAYERWMSGATDDD